MGGSSADTVARDIMEGLGDGRYVPGQRLIEADLMRRYGVSKGSVREALSLLVGEGVVVTERNRGAHIRVIDRQKALDSLVLIEALSGLLARLAAENIERAGAAARLRTAAQTLLAFEPTNPSLEHGRARFAFFETLMDIGDNREIRRILPSLQMAMLGAEDGERSERLKSARLGELRELAAAVLDGDGDRAEAVACQQVRRVIDHFLGAARR